MATSPAAIRNGSRSSKARQALGIFLGPDAYITPSWYAEKAKNGKVVPTWNFITVHAHGVIEFFDDQGPPAAAGDQAHRPA